MWAAYGDALGFITELTDSRGVERRIGAAEVRSTVNWQRRIGGQFGAIVDLPAGAISDDTQLRLATCRCISPDGSFDVEAFSKIELPVWPAYALGAGRGSRAAAANLSRRDTTWASNFFSGKGTDYVKGGGNGAAMRVQPHVWAAGKRDEGAVLHDVLVNALCTHGHPRGFLGAYFHARCLRFTIDERRPSEPDDWRRFVACFREAVDLLSADDTVRDLWIGPWERRFGQSLEAGIVGVEVEMLDDISTLEKIRRLKGLGAFRTAVEDLELYAPEQRGSGTKTALLAAAASLIFASDVEQGVLVCANALGTDTDTVASMTGALSGVLAEELPDRPVQDSDYISREAERMWAIGAGRLVPSFPFVDLLSWTPPRTQSDVVGRQNGALGLAGLGPVVDEGRSWPGAGREQADYGWLTLWFGQQVLAKRRHELASLPSEAIVKPDPAYRAGSLIDAPPRKTGSKVTKPSSGGRATLSRRAPALKGKRSDPVQVTLEIDERGKQDDQQTERGKGHWLAAVASARTMNELTAIVIRSGFDREIVGAGLLKSIDGFENGIERAVTYTAILAKARLARGSRTD
jgi:ADP-ribosylglycohydrolase